VATIALSGLIVHPLPSLTITSSSPIVCAGESVTITATGALQYTTAIGTFTGTIVHAPPVTMSLNVSGNDSLGCVGSFTFSQIVDPCTGVSEWESSALKLYPNPNNGRFLVKSDSDAELNVYNDIGQLVMQSKINAGITELELNEKAKGLYFVRITSLRKVDQLRMVTQ
jgi:hypothetical protein